jgi:hypothetical protein
MADEVIPVVRGVPFKKSGSASVREKIEKVLGPREASLANLVPALTPETALVAAQKAIEVRKRAKNYRQAYLGMEMDLLARGWEPNPLMILVAIANESCDDTVRVQAARALATFLCPKPATVVKGLIEQRTPTTQAMQEKVAGALSAIADELQKANG